MTYTWWDMLGVFVTGIVAGIFIGVILVGAILYRGTRD